MRPFDRIHKHVETRKLAGTILGHSLCLFLIFMSVYWISFYTFNPVFVQAPAGIRKYAVVGNNIPPNALTPLPDVGRCYIAAVIFSLGTVALLKLGGLY